MSMLKIPNMRVPYPEMADHGRHGIPDNLAYIDQGDFDDLDEFDSTSDKGYDSCKGTPKRTPKKKQVVRTDPPRIEPSGFANSSSGTRQVIVHVTFLKIGEINTLKEQFDADILVRSVWREPELDSYKPEPGEQVDWEKYWTPKVFIENAVGDPKVTQSRMVEHNANGEAWVTDRRRVKGAFIEQLELWEFPFDVQDLSIVVMSDLPAEQVEMIEDPDEVHKIYRQSFIDEQEWYLYKYVESEKKTIAKDRADPTIWRSTITVRCKAARRSLYFVWNIFSVTFLITCLAFLTFAVDHNLPQNRLQLAFTLILTSVAFKFVVNQSLPRISYLTYLDRYILAAMLVLATICFWHGIQTVLNIQEKNDFIALVVIIGIYVIYNVQFILRILLMPFRKRRTLSKAEKGYRALVKQQANQSTSFYGAPKVKVEK